MYLIHGFLILYVVIPLLKRLGAITAGVPIFDLSFHGVLRGGLYLGQRPCLAYELSSGTIVQGITSRRNRRIPSIRKILILQKSCDTGRWF